MCQLTAAYQSNDKFEHKTTDSYVTRLHNVKTQHTRTFCLLSTLTTRSYNTFSIAANPQLSGRLQMFCFVAYRRHQVHHWCVPLALPTLQQLAFSDNKRLIFRQRPNYGQAGYQLVSLFIGSPAVHHNFTMIFPR